MYAYCISFTPALITHVLTGVNSTNGTLSNKQGFFLRGRKRAESLSICPFYIILPHPPPPTLPRSAPPTPSQPTSTYLLPTHFHLPPPNPLPPTPSQPTSTYPLPTHLHLPPPNPPPPTPSRPTSTYPLQPTPPVTPRNSDTLCSFVH